MATSSTDAVPAYSEHRVPDDLAAVVVCAWTRAASGETDLTVYPDGCVDLVWRSDGQLFVAGPDGGPAVHERDADTSYDGVRLRTGVAGTVLGVGADELLDQQVDLDAVWGSRVGVHAEQLAGTSSAQERRAVLVAMVRERCADVGRPDAQVLAATEALTAGDVSVQALATDLGLSERQLHRRMCREVGYGPKTLDRVLRFQRFLKLGPVVSSGRRSLGWAAATAGYADQSHLVRECRRLAGSTPSEVVRRNAPRRV